MKNRGINAFSLAFLDVMFCGFGAVILFFMIINANTFERREKINYDITGEVRKLDVEILEAQRFLVELNNSLQEVDDELVETQGHSHEVIEKINKEKVELARLDKDTLSKLESIESLKTDLKSIEEENNRLEGGAEAQLEGDRLKEFSGQGQRQYLTGLKMGGERILILVDSSASMLADRIINVLRFRNLPANERVKAAKWQQVLYTVDWITTRIPSSSQFQIYSFNEAVSTSYEESGSQWLDGANGKHLNTAVKNLFNTAPENGTNLYKAFESISKLSPPPDNIYLLTDGLPTKSSSTNFGNTVSAKQRKKHFRKALEKLPGGIPVNIILFHMEGDPEASSEFWKLAQYTNGSFFSPSKDWP
ncbi:MAG: VWA domain-containing protein [Gammaproteobacteria bacterium]